MPLPEPRTRRGGMPKPPLSRLAIIRAALDLSDEDGSHALTMRTLAARLQASPGALYRYFSSRAELIDAMVDEVMSAVQVPTSAVGPGPSPRPSQGPQRGDTWQAVIERLALETIEALAAHPALGAELAGRVPTAPAALRISEAYLAVLLGAGIGPRPALLTVDLLNALTLTFAIELSAMRAAGGTDAFAGDQARLAALDPAEFPHLATLAREAMADTPGERIRWSIRTVLAGVS